jgi:hypothetical protein
MCARRLLGSLLILLVAAVSAPALAQTKPEAKKEKTIRRVLEVTGTQRMMAQMAGQMIATFKKAHPEVPNDFWDRFEQKLGSQELVDQLIPIYDKYYTQQDLEGLLTFYESPVGQKVLKTMPQVMQESMQIGQVWGQQKAQEVLKEIEEYRSKQKKTSESSL